jgi:hypothetical protein
MAAETKVATLAVEAVMEEVVVVSFLLLQHSLFPSKVHSSPGQFP